MAERELGVKVRRRRLPTIVLVDPDPLAIHKSPPSSSPGRIETKHKENTAGKPWAIANEYICGEIANFIRLPGIAQFALAKCDDEEKTQVFASLRFDFDERDPMPVRPDRCAKYLPEVVAAVIVFDVFVCNSDRNPSNVQVDDDLHPTFIQVFDHDLALFGNSYFGGVQRLRTLRRRLGITDGPVTDGWRHIFMDQISHSRFFAPWIDRVSWITHRWLSDLCHDAIRCGLTEEEAIEVADFLNERKWSLRSIFNRHQSEFTGIKKWELV